MKIRQKSAQFLLITKFQAAILSSIMTEVFKVTIGWLVNKGRDEAAKKLKDGDVTDQQLRGIIMREIDDIRSKLGDLSRKDLGASFKFLKEGIELLFEEFDEIRSRTRSEFGADTAQATCADVVSLTERMRNLELTESATRKLSTAKKRFKRAREMATIAFSNEALSITDRILAMQYRVMAIVLEAIENPSDAVAPCKVCIEELNSLPTVQQSFKVQLKTGISAVTGLFNKEERRKVISLVCLVNRVAYDVTQLSVKEPLPQWPMIDTEKEKVDLLRDRRVAKILHEQGMENCSLSWILGHDGEEEHGLNNPYDITANSSGQYIVADNDLTIKVFDNNGKFVQCFSLPHSIDDGGKELSIDTWPVHLATDKDDNIYVLVKDKSSERFHWIFKFNKTTDLHQWFRVGATSLDCCLCNLSVSDSGKVVVLTSNWGKQCFIVDVYETNGQFVCSFGEQILRYLWDITAVSDGRVMVVQQSSPSGVYIFSEQGEHQNKFDLERSLCFPKIAFHWESQQVVVADGKKYCSDLLNIGIYNKDGRFLRSTLIHLGESLILDGITVTTEGRIAVATRFEDKTRKVIII